MLMPAARVSGTGQGGDVSSSASSRGIPVVLQPRSGVCLRIFLKTLRAFFFCVARFLMRCIRRKMVLLCMIMKFLFYNIDSEILFQYSSRHDKKAGPPATDARAFGDGDENAGREMLPEGERV